MKDSQSVIIEPDNNLTKPFKVSFESNYPSSTLSVPKPKLRQRDLFLNLYYRTTICEKILLLFGLLLSAMRGSTSPIFALIVGSTADVLHTKDESETKIVEVLQRSAFLFCITGSVAFLSSIIAVGTIKFVSQRTIARLQKDYFNALLSQNLAWFDNNDPGKLARKGELESKIIIDGSQEKLFQMITSISSFVGGCTIAFSKGLWLTLTLLSVLPIQILIGVLFIKFVKKAALKRTASTGKAGTIAEEALWSIGTVVSLAAEDKEGARYTHALSRSQDGILKLRLAQGFCIGFFYASLYGFHILCFFAGSIWVENSANNSSINEFYTPTEVLTIFFAIFNGSFSLTILIPSLKATVEAKRAAYRVVDIIQETSEAMKKVTSGKKLTPLLGRVTFNNVTFSFASNPEKKILKGLNLDIEPGKKVVILGKSGFGKSTMSKLILRLYDPDDGSIQIDGIDIKTLDIKWLRENISYASKDSSLFTGTIKENLEMARSGATEEEMISALKEVDAYDFVMGLKNGLATVVGSEDKSLSDGQTQRLILARTVISRAKIMVLDQVTSALDPENTKKVMALFDKMREAGKTIVIFSDTLTETKNADKLVVINEGTVVEQGTHTTLLEHGRLYKSFREKWVSSIQGKDRSSRPLPNQKTDDTMILNALGDKTLDHKDIMKEYDQMQLSQIIMVEPSPHLKEPRGTIGAKIEPRIGSNLNNSTDKSNIYVIESPLYPKDTTDVEPSYINENPAEQSLVCLLEENQPDDRKKSRQITRVQRPKQFQMIPKPKKPQLNIKRYLKKLFDSTINHRILLFFCILISLMSGVIAPVFGTFLCKIAYALLNYDTEDLAGITQKNSLILVLIALGGLLLHAIQFALWDTLSQKMENNLRIKAFNKMLRMHLAWHEEPENCPSNLCAMLGIETLNVSKAINFVGGLIVQAFSSIVTAIVVGFILTWQIAVLSFLVGPMILLVIYVQTKVGRLLLTKSNEKKLASRLATDVVKNISTLLTLNSDDVKKKYNNLITTVQRRSTKIGFIQAFLLGTNVLLVASYFAAIFYFGSALSATENLGSENVFSALFPIIFSVFNVFAMLSLSGDIRNGILSTKNLCQYLDMKSKIDIDDPTQKYKMPIKGDIELRNVSFSYPGTKSNTKVFENLNFKIEAGRKIALIGPNGSGKSTIFKLLLRHYDVDSGEILIDGVNIKKYDLRHLRRGLGLVEQKPKLFYGTVQFNIK